MKARRATNCDIRNIPPAWRFVPSAVKQEVTKFAKAQKLSVKQLLSVTVEVVWDWGWKWSFIFGTGIFDVWEAKSNGAVLLFEPTWVGPRGCIDE
jgi:hypothetical protein